MKPVALGRSPGSEADPSQGALAPGRPLGVYVHFPFCGVRCPYCDFAVDTRQEIPHDAYADAVIAELAARRAWFEGAGPLASIYFGGGTPGLWRADALGRVLEAARLAFGAPDARALEITVEANPGEVDEAGLRVLRAVGVNRLSLGAQAFEDRLLRTLGRNHDAAAIPAAVRAARAAGFEALSLDLIFGIPEQTRDDWRRAVDAAVALAPDHVSAYALTIERGTAFGALDRAGKLPRPDDEEAAAMFEHAGVALAALRGLELRAARAPRAPQRALLVGRAVPGAGRVSRLVPPARRRHGLALLEPARDGDLPGGGARRRCDPAPRRAALRRRARGRGHLARPANGRRAGPRRPLRPLRPRPPRRPRRGAKLPGCGVAGRR